MVIYYVRWDIDPDLVRYPNRVKQPFFAFSVMCRNIKDAAACAQWYFYNEYSNSLNQDFTYLDGSITFKRVKVDSRGFNPNYLYADDIKEPIYLANLKKNRNIF